MKVDIPKLLFIAMLVGGMLLAVFAIGLYSGASKNALFHFVVDTRNAVKDAVGIVSEEASTMTGVHPSHFLEPARYPGAGVTLNAGGDASDLVFMSGFFKDTNELRLMRRNGEIVHRWPVVFSEIFPDSSHAQYPPRTDWNIETSGALITPDGEVVFNFGYGGLVKLDRCGEVEWTVRQPTHHSVERNDDGTYWVPSRRQLKTGTESPFPPFETPFWEDTMLRVSDSGEILQELSIPQLFYDNDMLPLFTATGHEFEAGMAWDMEMVHNNKIVELPAAMADDFPLFGAGDLMLSMRNLNLVMVIDGESLAVKWSSVGPWIRQHDPEFRPGGTVVVFNNNVFQTMQAIDYLDVPRVSNIVEIDPVSGDWTLLYGGSEARELLSIIGAKVDVTHSGGIVITEFGGGRVIELDSAGQRIWEYINRYDDDEVAEIIEARIYPNDYFRVADWACEAT